VKAKRESTKAKAPDPTKGALPGVNPYLCQYLSYCLEKTTLRLRTQLNKVWAKHGFTAGPQLGILSMLIRMGALNQVELGQQVQIDKASMVKFLDGLESLGMIKRVSDPNDRRAKFLEVTAKGRKTFDKVMIEVHDLEKEFLGVLSSQEIHEFRQILKKLLLASSNKARPH
jgi:DNA-binding MarR family transcriptional regulator